jgi:hypothetical protein
MAKSPNTTPINGYSASFTYKYKGWTVPEIYQDLTDEQKKRKEQEIELANELAWLDYVESEFIQDMLTYPDAERIINKLMKQGE